MKKVPLTKQEKELIFIAKNVVEKNRIEATRFSCCTGAALLSDRGEVFSGVNVRVRSSAPTSFCAETIAIGQMFCAGRRRIRCVAAVRMDEGSTVFKIVLPCGGCRHLLSQFGNPWVIVSSSKKVKLSELLPKV